ncbi:MAG: hypothetical protein ACREGC_01320 [Minisyncoccia bacterium]
MAEAVAITQDSFWQVNIQDVEILSKVKFGRDIIMNPDEVVPKSLPVNLCLVFNSDRHTYDRCTEAEELEAQGLSQTVVAVQNSAECARSADPFSCGENRDRAGITAGKDRSRTPDSTLPSDI